MAKGETLGKYQIRRTLGRGAAGVVLEGWDPIIERRVAIKTVRLDASDDPETREQIDRFRREARAAGQLVHSNIVTVYDYGEADGVAYIVMEFVEGPSLKDVLDLGRMLDHADVVRMMEDILAGLAYSHQHGVIHRDIKPGNVMLTSRDIRMARAKIADFGIARIESSTLTQAGTMMGTPAYMAPEQFLGNTIDARSDIYAAGALLYQLLTGQRPFEGSISSIMHQVLTTEARLPSAMTITVDPAFDPVVMRALAKRPVQRFQEAAAFAAALRDVAAGLAAEGGAKPEDQTIQDGSPATGATAPPARAVRAVAAEGGGTGWSMVVAAIGLLSAIGLGVWLFVLSGRQPIQDRIITPPPPRVIEATPGGAASTPAVTASPASPLTASEPVSPRTAAPARRTQPDPGLAPVPGGNAVGPVPPNLPAPDAGSSANQGFSPANTAALAGILAGMGCSLVDGGTTTDGAVLRGVAVAGAEARLRALLAERRIAGSVAWQVQDTDAVFCRTLDLLRPLVPGFDSDGPRMRLTLADDRTVLREGEAIRPRVIMPGFNGYLRVDYIAHDGTVQHLYPQVADVRQGIVADPVRVFAPSEWVNLGDPAPGQRGWEASEPFGRDMIITVASTRPLFATPRPANAEPAEAYLRALEDALRSARQAGADIAVAAIAVQVSPR